MTYADHSRRSSNDADLREAMRVTDEMLREAAERRRAEDEERDRVAAEKRRARAQQQAAAVEQQAQAAQYDWTDFYRDLDQRIASAVDARIAGYQESERASAEMMRELMGQLADMRRDLASSRDREANYKQRIATLETRMKQPGPLPVVKQWLVNTAALAGEMFAHHGAMWQCRANTGQEPQDGSNWLCVSAPGRDGEPGKSLRTRGLFRQGGSYKELDVVVHNGGSWVARVDNPGPCPGEGWQVASLPGKRGEQGERGLPGEKGASAASARITAWTMKDDYVAVPQHEGNRSGAPLNLRPYFEKYFQETQR
jgi:hypothetical protein